MMLRCCNRLSAVKTFGTRWSVLLFAVKGDVETFGHETLAKIFDALLGAEKGIGDVLVFPIVTITVENSRGTQNGMKVNIDERLPKRWGKELGEVIRIISKAKKLPVEYVSWE